MLKKYLGKIFVVSKMVWALTVSAVAVAAVSFDLYAAAPPSNLESGELLGYLKSENYKALNSELDKLIKYYESDYRGEEALDLALAELRVIDPQLEGKYIKWVSAMPDSSAAYLARGRYYSGLGWAKRGAKYYSETEKKQIDGMQFYFGKAFADLEKARGLDKKLVHALIFEMDMLKNFQARDKIRALRDEALTLNPYSLNVRWFYISTITPRWGGSMAQVEDEIRAARQYYDGNPRLKVLEGRIFSELGDHAALSKRFPEAVENYTKALSFGEFAYYYGQRAIAVYSMGDYSAAIVDANKAIKLNPFYSNAYFSRGFSSYKLQDYNSAISDYTKALSTTPQDATILDYRGEALLQSGYAEKALADFTEALKLAPGNSEFIADVKRAEGALQKTAN